MQFSLPDIRELRFEQTDFTFFHKEAFDPSKLSFQIKITASHLEGDQLLFFIHLRYVYQLSKKEEELVHCDFLLTSDIPSPQMSIGKLVVEKSDLAHILGTSILIMRGYIQCKLSGNILKDYQLPPINPLLMLEQDHESVEGNFHIPEFEGAKHREEEE